METDIVIRPERLKPLVTEEASFRSLYDFQVTNKDLEQAYSELGETKEIREECLKKLKEMLTGDQNYRTDDDYLLRYLRWRKFDCDKAFKSIKTFRNLKSKSPDYFSLPSNLEQLLNMGAVKCLPYRDENGSIIIWIDSRKWDLKHMSFCNLMQVANAISDIVSMNPSSQINSIISFWDVGGLTARHFLECINVSTIKTIMQGLQDSHPWRIRRVICFNSNAIIRTLYHVIIARIAKKIADRMKLLGSDVREIHEYINPTLLPKDYGGQIEESDCSVTQLVMDNLKYLEYEHSFCDTKTN